MPPAWRGPAFGAYGRFAGEPSADELAAAFFFDRADRALIARRRRAHDRLGFAVQLGTVRAVGTFLEDPAQVPAGAVGFAASQLGVADTADLSAYARGETRWDHQAEICRAYGFRDFSEPAARARLARWLSARAGSAPSARARSLPPPATGFAPRRCSCRRKSVLARIVAGAREEAPRRAHALLASVAPARAARAPPGAAPGPGRSARVGARAPAPGIGRPDRGRTRGGARAA